MTAEGIPVGDVYMLPVVYIHVWRGEEKEWRGGGGENDLCDKVCVV